MIEKNTRSIVASVLIFGGLISFNTFAQPGTLDNSFGTSGKIQEIFSNPFSTAHAVAIQSDGKIVVAGFTYQNLASDFALVRYNTNGTVDNTFGTSGKVETHIDVYDYAKGIVIQSDGKIVLGGTVYNGSDYDFGLVRYTADGVLDNTFGTAGITTLAIGPENDELNGLALTSSDEIIAVGYSKNIGGQKDFAVAKFSADGILDNTFGTSGIATAIFDNEDEEAMSVAVQSDGKIVVVGSAIVNESFVYTDHFAVTRYNADGTADVAFGEKLEDANEGRAYAVTIQSDQKILVGGYANDMDVSYLLRYETDGTLELSTSQSFMEGEESIYSIQVQDDGKIVAVGYGNSLTGNSDFLILRYDENGDIDNTFGTNGAVITTFDIYNDFARGVAIESGGKIVVVGNTLNSGSGNSSDFAIARYHSVTEAPNGLTDENSHASLTLYPNPVDGLVFLEITEPTYVEIFNTLGELVYSEQIQSSKQVDLAFLDAGIYFIYDSEGEYQKLIKE